MANIALKTSTPVARVEVVESIIQHTTVAAETVAAGSPVRIDTDGNFTNGNATTTTENPVYGLATKSAKAGEALTAIRKGVMDGFTLAGAFNSLVYLSDTDGRLADAAGTTTVVVGRVISGCANLIGQPKDKLLFIDL